MAINSTTETAIFERIVLPTEPKLTQAAAQSLLALDFSEEDTQRMRALLEKAQRGSLTPDESAAIENYERVGHYLGILHSKARLALAASNESAT